MYNVFQFTNMSVILSILPTIIVSVYSTSAFNLTNPPIVIVGAGAAGIAAATRLLKNNFTNLLILEAESTIGGRIHSVKLGDSYVDLGAQWCSGQKGNIVYELAKDLNIFRHSEYSYKLYHSSGKVMDEEMLQTLLDIRDSFYKVRSGTTAENVTVGELFINHFNQSINFKYSTDKEKLALASDALDFYLRSISSGDGSFSWFDPSAKTDYRDCEGDTQLNWNGLGYKTILDILMNKFPDPSKQLDIENKILLNKEVTRIQLDHQNARVIISCSDMSNYTANHVIFTPSIGVLKNRSVEFTPHLPEAKLRAIESIGIGGVVKVYVVFSSNWFGNETNFNFVWSEKHNTLLKKSGTSWLTNLFTIVRVENNSHILTAWFVGESVPLIELMPEDNLIEGIDYALRTFLGDLYQGAKIDNILRSQWYSNPHFRGVYSFQTIKSKRGHRGTRRSSEEDLAEPIVDVRGQPLLQFAGEATHPYHFATVHGAIETGYREADRIINLYKR